MALYGIGKTKIQLWLHQNDKWYEVVSQEITLTREPNVAARLTTSILRDAITAEVGDILKLVIDDGHHCFFGVITETSKSKEWCQVTAYDQIYYLNKSHLYYSYENKRASDLLKELALKEGLKYVDPPHIMDTPYVIPYRIEDNVTPLDMITKALDLTYKYTGQRFFLWDDSGNLCLHSEQWLAERARCIISMEFIENYSYKQDMNDLYTQVTVVSDANSSDESNGERTRYIASNDAMISKYGKIEYSDTLGEYENGDFKAQNLLQKKSQLNQRLSITGAQGDIVVKGGMPLFVDFFSKDNAEYIRGYFRTESVTHHLKGGHHTMDLDLSLMDMYDDWSDRNVGQTYTPS